MSEMCVGACGECPYVRQSVVEDIMLRMTQRFIEEQALSERVDETIAPLLFRLYQDNNMLGDIPDTDGPIESPEDLAVLMRQRSAEFLESLAKRREGAVTAVNGLTRNCKKPLKMRARRDGKVITSAVCMSPQIPNGSLAEQAFVTRESDT